MGSAIVERFERERPICVMAQMVLERLLSPVALDRLFEEEAENQYERQLLFSTLSRLMASVVLGRQPSVRAAYLNAQAEVDVSLTALYGKLDRIEPHLSQALVRYSYARMKEVSGELGLVECSPVAGYTPKIVDGNQLAATEHRLQETRCSTAAPLPGKSLVVLDPQRRAIADLFPIEDAYAQERTGLDDLIATLEAKDLWIGDCNFCTLKLLSAVAARGARFVIRQHGQLHGTSIGRRRPLGKTSTGKLFEQQLQLPEYEGQTQIVRRVELELFQPTRNGDTTLAVLTNLTSSEADAAQVVTTYADRWSIETAFCQLTTVLRCEVETLSYPKAALFAFSLACLAYNAVATVLAAITAERGQEQAAELSFYYLSLEIAHTHDGMMVAIPPRHWRQIRALPLSEYTRKLRDVARHIDVSLYRKSKRGPKKPKPPPRHKPNHVHLSTAQLLAKRKQTNAC